MRYSLQDFTNITFDGFNVVLPEDTMRIINDLASQVGSPTYIKTPDFNKKEGDSMRNVASSNSSINNSSNMESEFTGAYKKKRRYNKAIEVVNDDDWETLRSFQTTKIEQKDGIGALVDQIRSALNKMSDKNYTEQHGRIMEILEQVENVDENILHIGNAIFEIASNNRFYSKLYADLYCSLIDKYEVMNIIFETNFTLFMELFKTIEHVNPEDDYDLFCKVNKNNERRKSLSSFFVNLTLNKIISVPKLFQLTYDLLNQVNAFITQENKKNEVDEITENIAILYNKGLFEKSTECDYVEFIQVIKNLAHSKAKTFPSLSNKSIFKFMDMIDM